MNDQNKRVLLEIVFNVASEVILQNPKAPLKDKLVSSLYNNIPRLANLDINDAYPNYVPPEPDKQLKIVFAQNPDNFKEIARIVKR